MDGGVGEGGRAVLSCEEMVRHDGTGPSCRDKLTGNVYLLKSIGLQIER